MADPTHHFRESGIYTVVLTTENGKQFNSIAKTVKVEKAIWKINQMTAEFTKPYFEFVSDSTVYRQDAAHTFITGYQKISSGFALVDIHLPLNVSVGAYRIQDDEVVVNRWYGTVATNYNRKTATGEVYIKRIFNDTMWGSFNVMHGSWNYGSTYGEFKVAVE